MITAETTGEGGQEVNPVTPTSPESARGSARWSIRRSIEGALIGGILAAAVLGISMFWNGDLIESGHLEKMSFLGISTASGAIIWGARAFRETINEGFWPRYFRIKYRR